MGDMSENKRKTVDISRYSSRRLYNTHTSDYVTVDEIAKMIHDGYDIRVTDKKSGEDITRQILLQIIADQESRGGSVLPVNVLTDIVRSYKADVKSLVPEFLSESFAALKESQQTLVNSMQRQIQNPFDPKNAIENINALREAQAGIVSAVLQPWLPTSKDKPSKDPEAETNEPVEDEAPATDIEAELLQMKNQIEQLQEKLKDR